MNFLAHAYLSFGHDEILAGNMVSDFIKGKSKFDYPEGIQKGISLHRSIDAYTDNHAATRRAMQLFRPAYRLYSGAIMDVLYDHFLARDENIFPGQFLERFTADVYLALERQAHLLPARFRHMFFYMKTENWLLHYKQRAGIQKSLRGLIRRAAFLTESETAFRVFEENYDYLDQCYGEFIADVKEYAKQQFDLLVNKPTR
jgi:acyl carrier protein phosphodiesterase